MIGEAPKLDEMPASIQGQESGNVSGSGSGNGSGSGGTRTSRPRSQLRAACDSCNKSKTKCPGGNPCPLCQCSGIRCHYSVAHPLGRPKGSKNKRTLMREMQGNLGNGAGSGQFQPDRTGAAPSHIGNASPVGVQNQQQSLLEPQQQQQQQQQQQDQQNQQQNQQRQQLEQPQLHDQHQQQQEQQHHQQQQAPQQLLPSAFNNGLPSAGTTYGGGEKEHSPLDMDDRDLFSMLDQGMLMDAMTDDMTEFDHLVPQGLPNPMTMSESLTSLLNDDTSFEAAMLANEYSSSNSKLSSTDDSGMTVPTPDSSAHHRASSSVFGDASIAFSSGVASASRASTSSIVEQQPISVNIAPMTPAKSISAPRTPPLSAGPTCTCLPGLVTLVCQLEDLRHPPPPRHTSAQHHHQHQHPTSPYALKCILQGVQLAEEPWAGFMRCLNSTSSNKHTMQDDDVNGHHKHALALYAMSIRIILSSIHKYRIAIGMGGQQQSQPQRQQSFGGSAEDLDEAANVLVSVGGVHLAGEIKAEMIKIAVRQALRQTTAALMRLLERRGSRPSPASSSTAIPAPEYGTAHGRCEATAMMRDSSFQHSMSYGSVKTLPGSHANMVLEQDQLEKRESVAGLLSILQYTMKDLTDGEAFDWR